MAPFCLACASVALVFCQRTRAESGNWRHDWRSVDPYLPLDPANLHPTKTFQHKENRAMNGGLVGLPLQMGWEASMLFAQESEVEYRQYSIGKFCNNGGPAPFLAEGMFDIEECLTRCGQLHNCAFATYYTNHGWCQLGSRCVVEGVAGDPSAVTYAKAYRKDSCNANGQSSKCSGAPAADLIGTPITSR